MHFYAYKMRMKMPQLVNSKINLKTAKISI